MYELIQTGECSYYINCPAKIGVYRRNGTDVYLIDSGNDKDAGKKVKKILDANNWRLKGIINTHSHADHIGGNKYLQQNTGCMIFAPAGELAFVEYPSLEGAFIYGGFPHKDLRHKFLLAESSSAVSFSNHDFPSELNIVPLSGHSIDMVGVKIPDGTFFIGDSVSSERTLEKYKISFLYDVKAFFESLDFLENADAAVFVPSHADAVKDIREIVALNRDAANEIISSVLEILAEKMTFEELLTILFKKYSLIMSSEQHVLIGSTVRSYLSYLYDTGKVEPMFESGKMLWRCAEL